ncbi:MAG: uracil-DNA glycosylase [Nitrospirae bacterium]|nr:uracil-DNA glycosylase [Nitrospirota bacterium]MBF0535874.1 uracil-DNA glycosylase [Nitrospirota bacterium]MBF0617792.1 uracil-DNA glycosylase [Nitrospirota bacterium]
MDSNKIDCFKCRNFYITWDSKFPYGCRGLGFKSKALPSREVKIASGTECLKFIKKPDIRK